MSVGIRRAAPWVVSVSLAMLLVTSSARTSQDFTGVSWEDRGRRQVLSGQ